MKEKVDTVKIINNEGKEIECDVLFTFDSEETGKSYIAYTDNTKDKTGNIQVYASIYNPNEEKSALEPIKTEKEWKVVETVLNTLQEEIKNKMGNKKAEE